MQVSIPKTFKLGGRTWRVKRVGKRKWYGKTDPNICVIELSASCTHDELEQQTFLHELLHAVAITMGWSRLNNDEDKIDAVAGLLLQALTTAK